MISSAKKKHDVIERIQLIISGFLRLTLLLVAVHAVIQGRWSHLFTIILTLFLTFLPAIVEKNLRLTLPTEFEFIFVLFVYAANFMGEVQGYFTLYWWWDILLHSISGLNLGFIGFIILYLIYRRRQISAGPFLIVLFSFSFALAIGTIWEIYEFAMDSIFGFNMQKSGLEDTMWDLIVNAGGAFLASLIGYFYIKRGRGQILKRVLNKLFEKNPWLRSEIRNRQAD